MREGYQVAVTASAEEGLELAARQRPDAIILDVRLPGMDGLTALGRLRQVTRDAPVIVETAGHYDGPEGCLSIPGITAWTPRAMRSVVTGVDRHGDPVTIEGTGELSRALQHETDHLAGVLFLDRLTGEHRTQALSQLRSQQAAATSGR